MDTVFKIYDNTIGISFKWQKNTSLTQIIFRDTGFHLSIEEIELFLDQVQLSKINKSCLECKMGANCRSMLLRTPSSKVSLAVSSNELKDIEDLLKGTLFQLELNEYLQKIIN